MPTFALDDDWVEIDADDYDEEQDKYGTPLMGRVYVELPTNSPGVRLLKYYGLFAPEDYYDEESDEVLETDE